MRPLILRHLVVALLGGLNCVTGYNETISTGSSPTATLNKSPSATSLTGSIHPCASTTLSAAQETEAPLVDSSSDYKSNKEGSNNTTLKICIHIFEILSALCIFSLQGHQSVLGVFSEIRGEQYRFERLVNRLRGMADIASDDENEPPTLIWESQAACVSLFNTIADAPESIEVRRSIRTELERRGLDDYFKV